MVKAIKILKASIGISSNEAELMLQLPQPVILESLLTDYYDVEEIEYTSNLDGYINIINEPSREPRIEFTDHTIRISGDILALSRQASDPRWGIFGNEGLLYRFVLKLLEDEHNIYSYHACTMYDEPNNTLLVIIGSAGSGKTCFLLKGIEYGLKVFATEMTHFKVEEGNLTFYRGSQHDNIRVGNLVHSFPEAAKMLDVKIPETDDVWGKKFAVNLTKFQTNVSEISNPNVVIVLPHIEAERDEATLQEQTNRRKIAKTLFDNMSQKIGEPVLLYEQLAYPGLEDDQNLARRIETVYRFIDRKEVTRIVSTFAGTHNCWSGIYEPTN